MKIKVYVSTNKVGSKIERVLEIRNEDLEELDEQERKQTIEAYAEEQMFEMIEWGWEEMQP